MSAHDDYLDPDRYGLFEETSDNSIVEAAFSEHDGPHDLYRSTYKCTACGPSVGVCIRYVEVLSADGFDDYPHEVERETWLYCDDLHRLGTWEDMASRGELIVAICVSSIVEGIDATTDTHEIKCDPDSLVHQEIEGDAGELHRTLARLFDRAVTLVNEEATDLWQETHGCETCAAHWRSEGFTEGEWGPVEGCDGVTPVWKNCPNCEGAGVVI